MILAFFNHKGGVGKTTTTLNLGAALRRKGKKVLLVDIDPQANLTISAGVSPDITPTIDSVFRETLPAARCIVPTSSGDLLPASLDLSKTERDITNVLDRERILRRQLDPIKDQYEFILIDCPPSLGNLSINGVVAADKAYVPVQSEMLALKGLPVVMEIIDELHRKRINPGLELGGIIATMYDERKVVSKSVLSQLQQIFHRHIFSTVIRDNVVLAEAPASGKSIFEYAPRSHGASDYADLCNELLVRLERNQQFERTRSRAIKRAERAA